MSDISRPRAVLFDWDNTLIDSWVVIHDAMNVTLEAFGQTPWTLEESQARIARSMRDSFPELFGADWEEAARVFYDHFETIHLEKLTPLSGAADFLAHLHGDGIHMGVVSNKRGDILRRESTHLGWDKYFGRLVGANDAAQDKPSAAPIHMALEASGITAGAEVWYIGDTGVDLMAASAAACVPVLLRPEAPGEGEFPEHEPTLYAPDFKTLSNMLGSL